MRENKQKENGKGETCLQSIAEWNLFEEVFVSSVLATAFTFLLRSFGSLFECNLNSVEGPLTKVFCTTVNELIMTYF